MKAPEIVRRASGPAIATRGDGRILALNDSARELLDFPKDFDATGQSLYSLVKVRDVHGNRIAASAVPFYELIAEGEAPRSYELQVCRPSGETLRVSVSVVVVVLPEDERYQLVYFLRRIMRRRQADEVIERLIRDSQAQRLAAATPGGDGSHSNRRLTPRQTEVLRLVAKGQSGKEIANALGMRLNTARRHIQNILAKLEAHSKAEAVARAFSDRLL